MKNYKFAGFWVRGLAFAIDIALFFLLLALPPFKQLLDFLAQEARFLIPPSFAYTILGFIGVLFYFTIFWKLSGATPGKMFLRLKIVNEETGKPLTFTQCIIRFLSTYVSEGFFFMGLWWVNLDSRKQTWHDKIARTTVIKTIKPAKTEPEEEATEFTPLFPSFPSVKDNKRWKKGRTLFFVSIIFPVMIHIVHGGYFTYIYDEPLLPGVSEWLYAPIWAEENPKDNGFYYWLGIEIADEEDSFAKGYGIVQSANNFVLNNTPENKKKYDNMYNDMLKNTIKDSILREEFYWEDDLIAYWLNKPVELKSYYDKYSYIDKRLETIADKKYIRTTLLPFGEANDSIDFPTTYIPVTFSYLKNIYILSLYKQGNTKQAIDLARKNLKIWRKIGVSSENLLITWLSTGRQRLGISIFDDFLEISPGIAPELVKEILSLRPPNSFEKDFTQEVWHQALLKLTEIFDSTQYPQSFFKSKNFELTRKSIRRCRLKGFLPNKFINTYYKSCSNFAYDNSLSPNEYYNTTDKREKMQQEFNIQFHHPKIFDLLYAGKNVELGCDDYLHYEPLFERLHDIDGYINMLKLKTLILSQGVAKKDVPEFLQAHSDSLNNPYTLKPISWDEEKSSLCLKPSMKTLDDDMEELKIKFKED